MGILQQVWPGLSQGGTVDTSRARSEIEVLLEEIIAQNREILKVNKKLIEILSQVRRRDVIEVKYW